MAKLERSIKNCVWRSSFVIEGAPFVLSSVRGKKSRSITAIETNGDDYFVYFFVALGLCIRGFRNSILLIIVVDDTFLKRKFRGTFIVSVVQDENGQIFSVAFGVVDFENDAL